MKTLLFDNDGILVDTERLYFEANRRILAEHDVHLSEGEFADISLRQGRSLLRALLPGLTEAGLIDLHQRRNILYAALLSSEPLEIPGMAHLLEQLSGRCRMGIVTSSLREHFDLIHARLDLLIHFHFVLTREDYRNSKPAPDPYLLALERCSAAPPNCLVIEDSPRGQQAAIAAGLDCLILPSPYLAGSDFAPGSRMLTDIGQLARACQQFLAD